MVYRSSLTRKQLTPIDSLNVSISEGSCEKRLILEWIETFQHELGNSAHVEAFEDLFDGNVLLIIAKQLQTPRIKPRSPKNVFHK